MRVVVKDINSGKTTDVHIRLFDKVERLKSELQTKLDIKPSEQRLIFAGLELDEDCTALECNLKEGSTVELHSFTGDMIQILVKELTGKTLVLNVSRSDTVQSLKERIQEEKKEFLVVLQTLMFEGKELDSNETLEEYRIQHKSTLRLRLGMKLSLRMEEAKRTLSFVAEPTDQIRELMMEIERHEGIPQGRQRLIYDGRRLTPKDSLYDCGIHDGSTLDLIVMKKIWISVKFPDESIFTLDTEPEETIQEIKHKIHEEEGISCEEQYLSLGPYRLQDHWTVFDSNIQQNSMLRLTHRPEGSFRITVETITGKSMSMDAREQDTVLDLKRQIKDVEDISQDLQRLVFDGRVLEDSRPLSFYRIGEDSVVRLRTIMHVVVDVSDGRTLKLEGEPTDPIDKVKQMIADSEGIPKEEQTLWLDEHFDESI